MKRLFVQALSGTAKFYYKHDWIVGSGRVASSLCSILRRSPSVSLVVDSPMVAISSVRVNSDISKDVTSSAITKSAGCTPTAFMLGVGSCSVA